MANKMLIDATHAEETRVVVVDGNKVEDFDFESENKRQLAGNIYLAKVTRVEPSLQAAFVDYGGNRHGFLAFSEIHPDYYQIPVADREALLAEEMAFDAAEAEEEEEEKPKRRRGRGRGRAKAAEASKDDAVVTEAPAPEADGDAAESKAEEKAEVGAEADSEAPSEEAQAAPSEETTEAQADGGTPEDGEGKDEPDSDASEGDPEVEAEAEGEVEAQAETKAKEKQIPGMDVVDLGEDDDDETEGQPYNAADHAAQNDASVEAVSDDDSPEEIRRPRKQRPRRYKIQEVIKVRQVLLVQVVKEERGNKGAALTTYLSLAGRYCVLMPNTARGGGISRKITQANDRKKLKEIANEIDVPKGAGLIIRTAGAKRTKTEIKRDYEYLQRMWEQIRELTLKSIAPAKIYEEGNLIKRSIRDLYNRDIDEVLVEGEEGYRTAKDFMKMIMPSHAKNVKHYNDAMPLFARYQVESYLSSMFNPTVQLKSGGYIVIGVTEALVAIDVNSGKATKEGSIEETALKTNLEAAEEVARQLRLRDLAGLVVIDFIDMEERKNNSAVEKRFKDKLKNDRARIQVGRISAFGLLEMSRQRLRPGMLEATTQPCPSCHGTGLIRSDDSLGLTILRQIEEEGVRRRTKEVLIKAPVGIVNFLMNHKREHIAQIEARYGMAVRVEGDPFLVSPDFTMEKFKTATRIVRDAAPVVSADATLMAEVEEDLTQAEAEAEAESEAVEATEEDRPKRKRRRRRRRRGKGEGAQGDQTEGQSETTAEGEEASDETANGAVADAPAEPDEGEAKAEEKPKRKRTRTRKKPVAEAADGEPQAEEENAKSTEVHSEEATAKEPEAAAAEEAPAKPKRTRTRRKKTEPAPEPDAVAEEPLSAPEPQPPAVQDAPAEPEPVAEAAAPAEPVAETPEPVLEDASAEPAKPRRKGWWSMGR